MRLTLDFFCYYTLVITSASKWIGVPKTSQEIWIDAVKIVKSRSEAKQACQENNGHLWVFWNRKVVMFIIKKLSISEGKRSLGFVVTFAINSF